ncbi:hypothetical protein GBAR_LOCUS6673 [Geodia barretti]|uniref:MHD2 domain-containing protein n=1 Tax=Geodia barretti TaxID=519541 RepID=A0AA35W6K8_GEOBA|nr:hypothetical protein GBAR_LOCUS6673 [Geodia barretti]
MCEFSLVIVICKQLRIGAYEPDCLFIAKWLVFRYCGRLYCRRCVKSECFVYLVSGVQMNTFFKPALSLLLELNLGDTGIERRLHPLITFLTRHRAALRKYIYPECFATLMNYLWSYILQDLEEEAIKLRDSKKPVTSKAQMLLQALSHLMEFVHDKGGGVPLHILTPTCEYLLALLDVMTRSTDQLITIFNKLSAPKFAMSRLDLSRTPVQLDPGVIHTLHSQLHTFKKCFSGKEFVEQLLKLGRETEATRQNSSEPTTPSPQIAFQQRSPRTGNRHIYNSPTTSGASPRIFYTVHYAKEVGQFLLSELILLPLPTLRQRSSDYDSEDEEDEEGEEEVREGDSRQHESSSIQTHERVVRRVSVEGGGRGDGVNHPKTIPSSTENSPRLQPSSRSTRAPFDYRIDTHNGSNPASRLAAVFTYSPQSLYKFADVEDFESRALYHSQILSASAHPQAADGMEETTAFEKARMGLLFLVYDLLQQRTRREKRVKQFLQMPGALTVADRRKRQFVDCNLIFKM